MTDVGGFEGKLHKTAYVAEFIGWRWVGRATEFPGITYTHLASASCALDGIKACVDRYVTEQTDIAGYAAIGAEAA